MILGESECKNTSVHLKSKNSSIHSKRRYIKSGGTHMSRKRERLVYFQCSFNEDGAVEADLGGLGIPEQRQHPLLLLEQQLLHR